MLAEKFTKTAEANGVAVVFVSSDRDQAAFDEYYGEMPWLALLFSEREGKARREVWCARHPVHTSSCSMTKEISSPRRVALRLTIT